MCPSPNHIKIKLLIPELERRLRGIYSYWKVVSVAFEKCNPVCLILFLKGHSAYCPNVIIKIFHLGIGQWFIKLSLCPCRYVPTLWKTQQTISDTVASGKVNSTDGVKYVFSFPLNLPASNRGRQIVEREYGRKLTSFSLFPSFILRGSIIPINLERIGRFSLENFSLYFHFERREGPGESEQEWCFIETQDDISEDWQAWCGSVSTWKSRLVTSGLCGHEAYFGGCLWIQWWFSLWA